MKIIKHTIGLLLLSALTCFSADLLNLNIGFENESWKEVVGIKGNNIGKKCKVISLDNKNVLEIKNGIVLKTQQYPYYLGDINISMDAGLTDIKAGVKPYHVAWCSIHYYDASGRDIGHSDIINTGKATEWQNFKLSVTDNKVNANVASFSIYVRNLGRSGTLWIDNLKVNVSVEGDALCGDPGFKGSFAVDHWTNLREGKDWDNLAVKSKDGYSRYEEGIFPDGGNSLHIHNNATFRSARYSYNGESFIFGAWCKLKGITEGKKPWCWANVQLVTYDDNDNVLGHMDLTPLKVSDLPWTYFSRTFPAGKFTKNTTSFELWARGFEGSTGDSWYDELQVVLLPKDDKNEKPYNAKTANVVVDATKPAKEIISPVWDAADLSYCSKIQNDVVKQLLTDMHKNGLKNLRMREFMEGCKIFKGQDKNGKNIYDWSTVDSIMDWVINEKGFVPTLTIESTPNQIAQVPLQKKKIYCNRSAPKDFKLWEQIATDLLDHWVLRYGLLNVKEWTFECWNEPCTERYYTGSQKDFLKIFEAYLNAIKTIETKYNCSLKTASFSGVADSPFYKMLFTDLDEKKRLDELDIISMHIYSGFVNSFDSLVDKIKAIQKRAAHYPELKNAGIILTEVNGASMKHPGRDSHLSAAFNVKANRVYLDTGVTRGYYFAPVDYQHRNRDRYFEGGSGMFTKNGIPKASFNSLVLMDKLTGGKRVPLTSSNEPLDGIAVVSKETVKVLLTSFDERSLNENKSATVKLKINCPAGKSFTQATLCRVDFQTANSYAKWLEIGKPKISAANDKILREANLLKEEEFSGFSQKGNVITTELTMPLNAIFYLKFK